MGEFAVIQKQIEELGWGRKIRIVPGMVDDEFQTTYTVTMEIPDGMILRGAIRVQPVKNKTTFSVRLINEDKALQRALVRGTASNGFFIQVYMADDRSQILGMGYIKTLDLAGMMKSHVSEIKVLKCRTDGNDFKIVYWGDLKKWGSKTMMRYDVHTGKKEVPVGAKWF